MAYPLLQIAERFIFFIIADFGQNFNSFFQKNAVSFQNPLAFISVLRHDATAESSGKKIVSRQTGVCNHASPARKVNQPPTHNLKSTMTSILYLLTVKKSMAFIKTCARDGG